MISKLLIGASLIGFMTPVFANTDHAKTLLQNNCIGCHQADIYKRTNRKVTSLTGLSTAVENCNTQLATGWFPEDVDAVVQYLNQTYYKFKKQ
ncbi:MAG: cytochrome c [Proteobacteria bacterium]|nr:cytochrome c [Pseudomonadota bacterium]